MERHFRSRLLRYEIKAGKAYDSEADNHDACHRTALEGKSECGLETLARSLCGADIGPYRYPHTHKAGKSRTDGSDHKTDSRGLTLWPLHSPSSQDGKVGFMLWYGNFICDNPRHNGVIRGLT